MPASIFRTTGRRTNLQPQSSAQNFIDVHNEDELLAALTALPRGDGNCYGKGINIVADITLTRALLMSADIHDGITISTPGRARINAGGFAISVAAADAVIKDIWFVSPGLLTLSGERSSLSGVRLTNSLGVLIEADDIIVFNIPKFSAGVGATAAFTVKSFNVSIRDIRIYEGTAAFTSDLDLVDGAGKVFFRDVQSFTGSGVLVSSSGLPVSEIWIIDCIASGHGAVDDITISGQLWVVRGNRLNSSSIIRATAVTGGSSVIAGNLLVGSIITNAGSGYNTITGNVNVGTLTTDLFDAVGLNT